ncbi:cellulose binding domain-containing protein [Streptomyces arboris]|uniref:cellulose binding domain-containing protein n=1 Tax=Streptomyces arboris TaxID=2600619 RepID=UPI003BF55438
MSQTATRRRQTRRAVIGATPAPEIGRGLWDSEFGPMETYARLCTRDTAAAERLVLQAEEHSRTAAQQGVCAAEGLPTAVVALNSVLDTAVTWATLPADRAWLSDQLLEWLEGAAGADTVQEGTEEPLAVSGLRGLAAFDAELFWWSCVEGLPDVWLARRLGRSVAQVRDDVLRVTAEFRKRSSLAHSFRTQDSVCQSYAGLLDATARQCVASLPVDLQRHLQECPTCTEDFECLSADGTELPAAVAEAVLRWNGSAYVASRRKEPSDAGVYTVKQPARSRRSPRRRSSTHLGKCLPLLWVAGAVCGMALVASSLQLVKDSTFPRYVPPPRTMPEPQPDRSPEPPPTPKASAPSHAGTDSSRKPDYDRVAKKDSRSKPPSAERSPDRQAAGGPAPVSNEPPPQSPACTAVFDVTTSWDGGVEGQLVLTPQWALQDWSVTFLLPEGETETYTYNGTHTKKGSHVTVKAANYNRTSAAGAALSIGLVLRGDADNGTWVSDVRVDDRPCAL